MGNPMDVAMAMMAFQRDAAEQIRACTEALEAAGSGFSEDDRAAVAASAAANSYPAGYDPNAPASPEDIAAAQAMAAKAMDDDYPKDGFASDDPRIQPIEGVSIALYALGTRAIGWATDETFIARVVGALGIDIAVWGRTSAAWSKRIRDDVVLAAFYGQLFAQA